MKNGFMVSIGVADLDASVRFYTEFLGLELIRRVEPDDDPEFAFLHWREQIELQLINRRSEVPPSNEDSTVTLSFRTHDIKGRRDRLLDSPYKIDTGVREMKTGVRILPFADPDGVKLSFIEEPNKLDA